LKFNYVFPRDETVSNIKILAANTSDKKTVSEDKRRARLDKKARAKINLKLKMKRELHLIKGTKEIRQEEELKVCY